MWIHTSGHCSIPWGLSGHVKNHIWNFGLWCTLHGSIHLDGNDLHNFRLWSISQDHLVHVKIPNFRLHFCNSSTIFQLHFCNSSIHISAAFFSFHLALFLSRPIFSPIFASNLNLFLAALFSSHLDLFSASFFHFIWTYFQLHFCIWPEPVFSCIFSFHPDLYSAAFFHFTWTYFWLHFCISSRHIFSCFFSFCPLNIQIHLQISEHSIWPNDPHEMTPFQTFHTTPKSLVSHWATLWPINLLQVIIHLAQQLTMS